MWICGNRAAWNCQKEVSLRKCGLKSLIALGLLLMILSCVGCARYVAGKGPGTKVPVCHKGKKTIYIDESAVSAHLNHGDTLGVCP
jgi:hypothetical protein